MRRGLISWSKDELSEGVLDGRIAALQAAMATAGLDAVVAYTTPARAAAVAWLAGFVPYWNQGLLVVPRAGRPILVSALSNRVNDWLRRNANVADVRNAARIGQEAGKTVAALTPSAAVGVIDLPHLPATVVDDLAAEGHTVSDASPLMRALRAVADPADRALHEKAAEIARRALAAIEPSECSAARLVARLDGEARRAGAEEVYPALAVDLSRSRRLMRLEGQAELGDTWAVRLSLAYKGAWVRVTTTRSRDPGSAPRLAAAGQTFREAIAALPRTDALRGTASWLVEGTRTALPLEPLAGSMIDAPEPLPHGSIVTVNATLEVEETSVLLAEPVLIGEAASALLAPA